MEKPYVSLLVELFHSTVHGAHLTEEQMAESADNWPEKEAAILAVLRKPATTHVHPEDTHVPHA
jgi:hypothetical protein